jgi:glutamate synthase (NADPH/NADH) small chain
MKARKHPPVPLPAEEALNRLKSAEGEGLLLSAAPDFYLPEDIPLEARAALRLVHVRRVEGVWHLSLPWAEASEHRIYAEDQVWLLANAARTLRRLGLAGDSLCRVDAPLALASGAFRVVNVHGQPVDLGREVALDELRGLSLVREWAATSAPGVEPAPESALPKLVSQEEALRIAIGERPGVHLALSSRGQFAAVSENSRVSPFSPQTHLAIVCYAGGLRHDEVTLFLEVSAPEEVDTLAWRLRTVAQRLIALGVPAASRCIVVVEKGELLLNPIGRVRDPNGRPFRPTQLYRLSEVRSFRDVEDLPSLKRPPEERIFDAEPALAGDYTLEQVLREAARCMECGLCRDICPNGVGLAAYVEHLKRGDLDAAARELRERNPGVDLTCLVCPAPCQEMCILTHEEIPKRPVNIRAIERVLAQRVVPPEDIPAPAATGFRVALIGLGPANVVAAARLARLGHEVHVFEQHQEFGGAVALIPSFRLPHAKAREWVQQLLGASGVHIHSGVALGRDLQWEDLREHFDAVVVGIGAGKPLGLGIEGESLGGVVDALQVLRRFNQRALGEPAEPPPRLRNTVVIGGGDVAADVVRWYVRAAAQSARAALEARRAGLAAEPDVVNVVWAYRRGRAEMPVSPEILADAEDEISALKDFQASAGVGPASGELSSGVYFHLRPVWVLGRNGRVSGIEFIRTRPGRERDRRGRPIAEDIPGSEFVIPADSVVVLAVGQQPDSTPLKNVPGLVWDRNGRVRVDETMKAAEGLYAVGDLVGGEILADAISHGRRAADSIHREYLSRRVAGDSGR